MDNFGILHHKVVEIFIFFIIFLLFCWPKWVFGLENDDFFARRGFLSDSLVTRQKALTLQRKQYKGNV